MARAYQQKNVRPELEVFELGHIELAKQLLAEGLIDQPALFQLCLGIKYGAPATSEAMKAMRDALPPGSHWSAFGLGRMQMPMVAQSRASRRQCARGSRGQSLSGQGRARDQCPIGRTRPRDHRTLGRARAERAGNCERELGLIRSLKFRRKSAAPARPAAAAPRRSRILRWAGTAATARLDNSAKGAKSWPSTAALIDLFDPMIARNDRGIDLAHRQRRALRGSTAFPRSDAPATGPPTRRIPADSQIKTRTPRIARFASAASHSRRKVRVKSA